MKMRVMSLGFFLVCSAQARLVEVPHWIDQVDSLLSWVQGIDQMLKDDARLYANWNKSLEGMFKEFERREADRMKLFCVVREKISLLHSQLALSEADKAAQQEESEITIRELQATIVSIRQDAQHEINHLTALVETLNQQIQEAREAYATLVNLDEQKVAALISELTAIKQAYNCMIDERTLFIATLDRFVKKTREFMAKEGVDMKKLGIELIGASYCDSEPTHDQPASLPDSGCSEEDEVDECGAACEVVID